MVGWHKKTSKTSNECQRITTEWHKTGSAIRKRRKRVAREIRRRQRKMREEQSYDNETNGQENVEESIHFNGPAAQMVMSPFQQPGKPLHAANVISNRSITLESK